MNAADDRRVVIFDTTLRDGEQAPGCSMTLDEKLRVAAALRELRVDIIEAGFPAASPGDFESVQTIARTIEGPTVCGLARCNPKDIKRAWDALKDVPSPRIHVFVATSQIHREHKLQMAKEEIIRVAVDSVTLARSMCEDVEFSPEDAARTEPEYLAEVVQAVIEAGATTVNIPDTVGGGARFFQQPRYRAASRGGSFFPKILILRRFEEGAVFSLSRPRTTCLN